MTGQPGWMRFGYSPGWVDRSPDGLPPTAQWLQSQEDLTPGSIPPGGQAPIIPGATGVPFSPFGPELTKEQKSQMLKQQADFLSQQLEQIKTRLKELTEGGL